ncbi:MULTISPECIES: ABC transporter permease [Clostridium]|jgi:oligopeptide transport system permease protein|uniref:Oligopeptide transport system permease protein OppC n=1 Tax=Clostridium saccharoperbutylacetonicum N1-4(HMT) TaxID=931276 RepID=M1N7J3_9CLOT|nr:MULTISPECIES: ABC transporter permease [Clostridium]AGF59342.1 oligopeptide transport system permease protein OppC [Clostridium saccharoperbutylacetonicum N1-4(HMT)]AQR98013.1 oligopeptide transport system permease protein OppC [Clostridium saccharoperbutylacetonicum]NRT59870.1 oligopeptide transport system permease protein [Clostridium saccharoperbutylacetonicum]NSB23182.1 oligopeptide transport system permease protein [Clostridium saccharoperbutylacetonicum]NSB33906.1 oligopeptide transpo
MENQIKIDKELFAPLSAEEKKVSVAVRPSIGYWKDAWNRLKKDKMALVSLIAIVLVVIGAIFVPMFSKYDYATNDLANTYLKPSAEHWFGTDNLGRDLFVRNFFGARYSLLIAVLAAVINLCIGVVYGGIAGYFGGVVDNILMRIVDVISSIPMTIYVVIFMAVLNKPGANGSGLFTIVLGLSITSWIGMARIVRGDVLQLKQQEFVLAAKSLGASNSRILVRHLIPNCIGSIMVTLTLFIPDAVFTEAFLSFIGLGIAAPRASLGTLANDAQQAIYTYPLQLLFPSAMICIIILCFNLFGDGLSQALDPKNKR